jgi:hypothetical protein
MRPRISHSLMHPGEYDLDTDSHIIDPTLTYMAIGDWGNVVVQVKNNKISWHHYFHLPPNWEELENGLHLIESGLREVYGLKAVGLCKRALVQIQFNWEGD